MNTEFPRPTVVGYDELLCLKLIGEITAAVCRVSFNSDTQPGAEIAAALAFCLATFTAKS
jgi:hypothetical protein